MDDLIPELRCPRCKILLRDGTNALVCPECGPVEPYPDITLPAEFTGPDLDERRGTP